MATSAYQIEGAAGVDGRGASIWDDFSHRPGTIMDGTTGDIACDHYHRYRDDVTLMAELGVQDYRFSIAWPRIQPAGNHVVNSAGLDFYSRLVDTLLERQIRPIATLYHWDLPLALQTTGGWLRRDTAYRFADYAATVATALGDRIPIFTTLNEPWCAAFLGYASGHHAPGIQDAASAYAAAHHLLLAHGLAVTALRSQLPETAQVWLTVNPVHTRPATGRQEDVRAARDAELNQNHQFLDPVLRGALNEELVERTGSLTDWSFVQDGDLGTINQKIDVLGVNYYCPHLVTASPSPGATAWPGLEDCWVLPEPAPVTAMGWPVRPATLTKLLRKLTHDYSQLPLAITENGAAYPDRQVADDGSVDDPERQAYLEAHVGAVLDAIESGVDVVGYCAWSWLDNFEWAWGLSQRFGLVHVDFASLKRTPKASARTYSRIIREHGL